MEREVKFQFIIDNKIVSKSYTFDECMSKDHMDIVEDMETCDCFLTESVNYCEGACIKYENSKVTGVRQYTGRKDKHGKDIYDGDLMRDGSIEYPYLYEVFWHDKYQWCLRHFNGKQFSGSLSNDKYVVPEEMRVKIVGNIYENQELIKIKTDEII